MKLSEDFTLDQWFSWLKSNRQEGEDLLITSQRLVVEAAFYRWGNQRRTLDRVANDLCFQQTSPSAKRVHACRKAKKFGVSWGNRYGVSDEQCSGEEPSRSQEAQSETGST